MASVSFPDPASPEGQAWAAAGFPVDPATGAPVVPVLPPPEPRELPGVGSIVGYTFHDDYAEPARERTQVILVTARDEASGHVRGFALGMADDAGSFDPGLLD